MKLQNENRRAWPSAKLKINSETLVARFKDEHSMLTWKSKCMKF